MKPHPKLHQAEYKQTLKSLLKLYPSQSIHFREFLELLSQNNIRVTCKSEILKMSKFFNNPLKICNIYVPLLYMDLQQVQVAESGRKYFLIKITNTQVYPGLLTQHLQPTVKPQCPPPNPNITIINPKQTQHPEMHSEHSTLECLSMLVRNLKKLYGSQNNWFHALGGEAVAICIGRHIFRRNLFKVLGGTEHAVNRCVGRLLNLFSNDIHDSNVNNTKADIYWKNFIQIIDNYLIYTNSKDISIPKTSPQKQCREQKKSSLQKPKVSALRLSPPKVVNPQSQQGLKNLHMDLYINNAKDIYTSSELSLRRTLLTSHSCHSNGNTMRKSQLSYNYHNNSNNYHNQSNTSNNTNNNQNTADDRAYDCNIRQSTKTNEQIAQLQDFKQQSNYLDRFFSISAKKCPMFKKSATNPNPNVNISNKSVSLARTTTVEGGFKLAKTNSLYRKNKTQFNFYYGGSSSVQRGSGSKVRMVKGVWGGQEGDVINSSHEQNRNTGTTNPAPNPNPPPQKPITPLNLILKQHKKSRKVYQQVTQPSPDHYNNINNNSILYPTFSTRPKSVHRKLLNSGNDGETVRGDDLNLEDCISRIHANGGSSNRCRDRQVGKFDTNRSNNNQQSERAPIAKQTQPKQVPKTSNMTKIKNMHKRNKTYNFENYDLRAQSLWEQEQKQENREKVILKQRLQTSQKRQRQFWRYNPTTQPTITSYTNTKLPVSSSHNPPKFPPGLLHITSNRRPTCNSDSAQEQTGQRNMVLCPQIRINSLVAQPRGYGNGRGRDAGDTGDSKLDEYIVIIENQAGVEVEL